MCNGFSADTTPMEGSVVQLKGNLYSDHIACARSRCPALRLWLAEYSPDRYRHHCTPYVSATLVGGVSTYSDLPRDPELHTGSPLDSTSATGFRPDPRRYTAPSSAIWRHSTSSRSRLWFGTPTKIPPDSSYGWRTCLPLSERRPMDSPSRFYLTLSFGELVYGIQGEAEA